MNVLDAAHQIAHEYPGGAPALAVRMGFKSPKVFEGKVNPNDPTHILGLLEALRMQELSERYDILYAMADQLGHVAIRLPDVDNGDVSRLLADFCGEFGDYMREIDKSMSDKRVTPNEAKRLQKELIEMIAAATRLNSRLTQMVGKP